MKKNLSLGLALLLGPALWAQPRLSWISTNVHPAHHAEAPARLTADTTLTVWRGERASMQAVVYATEATGPLQLRWAGKPKSATQAQAEARFVRYVTTDNFPYSG